MVKIAKYFNSIDYVVICVICFQIMLVIDTATLLYTSFPDIMNVYARFVAAFFGAVTIEAFLLMISVNKDLLESQYGKRFIPILFGVVSMVMTLFFMDTFTYIDYVVTLKRIFISFIFGAINYLLSEVFVKKWQQYMSDKEYNESLNDLKQSLLISSDKLLESQREYEEINLKHESLVSDYVHLQHNINILQEENKRLNFKISRKPDKNKSVNEILNIKTSHL